MPDYFHDRSTGLESPGQSAAAVSPDDAIDLAVTSRALYIGTGGDIALTTAAGDIVTFRNVAPGILPLRVSRVHQTGTTATDIVAVW